MTDRDRYHSPTLVDLQTWDLWQRLDLMHLCDRGSTGKKGSNRGFKADMLSAYGTVAVDVGDKMKGLGFNTGTVIYYRWDRPYNNIKINTRQVTLSFAVSEVCE